MMAKKTDRRVERTRRLIQQALVSLILEKRYDKITVQEIIDRANVGRSTFYAHFQDKEDVLASNFANYEAQWDTQLEGADPTADKGSSHVLHSLEFFLHADEQYKFHQAMFEGGGAEVMIETGRQHMMVDIQNHLMDLLPEGEELAIPLTVIANFLAGSLLSVMVWWLKEKRPYSPEEINEMFQKLAMHGVESLFAAD
jgi:AcrR family transcriptional regulator